MNPLPAVTARRHRHTAPGAEVWGTVCAGGRPEAHLLAWPTRDAPFVDQCRDVFAAYDEACAALGLSAATEVLWTLHLSDPANQVDRLAPLLAGRCGGTAVSVLGQAPLAVGPAAGGAAASPARVALRATHLGGDAAKTALGPIPTPGGSVAAAPPPRPGATPPVDPSGETTALAGGWRVAHGPYTDVWLPDLAAPEPEAIFLRLDAAARLLGWPLRRALRRTWIVVRDIDRHYGALLHARREAFAAAGMGAPLPASTGIGGTPADPLATVGVTALLLDGVAPEQIDALVAPSHLPPAPSYGASFERGLVIRYGDRRHVHLSGTASIGPSGDVLHRGDVAAQVRRTVENIAALLGPAGATAQDFAYLLVYLRDAAEAATVEAALAAAGWGGIPRLLLHAPVCRPDWLVEIEGVAVCPAADPRWAPY